MVFKVDGACRNNGRYGATGAAAAVWERRFNARHRKAHLPSRLTPTNQRAELQAIFMAQEWAIEIYNGLRGYPSTRITIFTDSRYAVGCLTDWIHKWLENGFVNARGVEVANRDLIEQASNLDDKLRVLGRVTYQWISRDENSRADGYCNEALDELE